MVRSAGVATVRPDCMRAWVRFWAANWSSGSDPGTSTEAVRTGSSWPGWISLGCGESVGAAGGRDWAGARSAALNRAQDKVSARDAEVRREER